MSKSSATKPDLEQNIRNWLKQEKKETNIGVRSFEQSQKGPSLSNIIQSYLDPPKPTSKRPSRAAHDKARRKRKNAKRLANNLKAKDLTNNEMDDIQHEINKTTYKFRGLVKTIPPKK